MTKEDCYFVWAVLLGNISDNVRGVVVSSHNNRFVIVYVFLSLPREDDFECIEDCKNDVFDKKDESDFYSALDFDYIVDENQPLTKFGEKIFYIKRNPVC
jgi:hypothetical protein